MNRRYFVFSLAGMVLASLLICGCSDNERKRGIDGGGGNTIVDTNEFGSEWELTFNQPAGPVNDEHLIFPVLLKSGVAQNLSDYPGHKFEYELGDPTKGSLVANGGTTKFVPLVDGLTDLTVTFIYDGKTLRTTFRNAFEVDLSPSTPNTSAEPVSVSASIDPIKLVVNGSITFALTMELDNGASDTPLASEVSVSIDNGAIASPNVNSNSTVTVDALATAGNGNLTIEVTRNSKTVTLVVPVEVIEVPVVPLVDRAIDHASLFAGMVSDLDHISLAYDTAGVQVDPATPAMVVIETPHTRDSGTAYTTVYFYLPNATATDTPHALNFKFDAGGQFVQNSSNAWVLRSGEFPQHYLNRAAAVYSGSWVKIENFPVPAHGFVEFKIANNYDSADPAALDLAEDEMREDEAGQNRRGWVRLCVDKDTGDVAAYDGTNANPAP